MMGAIKKTKTVGIDGVAKTTAIRMRKRQQLFARFPSSRADLIALARSATTPVTKCKTGYHLGHVPECLMLLS
jgi:hypothetical protein